jgi:hypothetical protein
MAPRHVGGCPGLVDEDQPLGVEIKLALEPCLPPLQDVGPILLRRVTGLFLRVIPWRSKNRHSVAMLTLTPCSASITCNSASVGSGSCLIASMHGVPPAKFVRIMILNEFRRIVMQSQKILLPIRTGVMVRNGKEAEAYVLTK